MSEINLSNEEKKKYAKEFCDFLIERIQNVGGSLQFQHLMGLLPQLSYETKKAVGSTKSELMKFLRAHNKKFKIDAKGIVSVIDSSVSDSDSDIDFKNGPVNQMNSLPSIIQEGMGIICKLHPEFGFINASEPFETSVHFAASEFGGNKDALLTDFDLEVGTEVFFNAVKGHNDYDAKYRATKVWTQVKSDAEDNAYDEKHNKINKLEGVGKIQKVFPDIGFISVDEAKYNTVFFHRNNFVGCNNNNDLTKILKAGDHVVFSAVKSQKKDCKAQWQATEVYKNDKRSKECVQPSSTHTVKKEMIKSQDGKIYPNNSGTTIKFGEKFSQSANGDSSVYFLYGARVTDIPWEFSLGDDVCFDAVKVKSGWKAVLVWVGERPDFVLPTCLGDFSEFMEEEDVGDNDNQKSTPSSSVYFSESFTSSAQSTDIKSNQFSHFNSKQSKKERNFESYDHFARRDKSESERTFRKNKTHSSRDSSLSSYSSKESKNYKKPKEGHKNEIPYLNKPKDNNAKFNRNCDRPNHGKVQYNKYKKSLSDCNKLENKNDIIDDTELENFSSSKNYTTRKKEFNSKSAKHKFLSGTEEQTNVDSESKDHVSNKKEKVIPEKASNVSNKKEKTTTGKASIKTFKSIDGTVKSILCKLAFVTNSELREDILFSSSVFYSNNGCPVEDQQVEDLREIISEGDTIKINCFEIVDDFGEFHHQVTMAWSGIKPKAYEMTPEEFIKRNELSVTVDDKSATGNGKGETDSPRKFLAAVSGSDSENGYLSDCQYESASSHSSSDEITLPCKDFTPEVCEYKEPEKEMDSTSVHMKPLHQIISDRLKSKGPLFSDSKVNLDAVSNEIIDLVLKHHKTEGFNNCQTKVKVGDSICHSCFQKSNATFSNSDVQLSNKEVQTIITGEVIAQISFTPK